ncbi:calmodulin-dependent protein kinase type [Seminavis robusta]|uniref:Calmodulin-dependent protein kinase type n=1 Tax=Seminavis robusta TaxID=568900 RepID=A0A9N8HKH3_9STRA|nr:calmodulin-dependent protein kinase type [Seminavis robusta]|eukprot:Sro944_g222910.1 calmodulin-dependent protein kinase type (453) ;mRNA; f:13556-14914
MTNNHATMTSAGAVAEEPSFDLYREIEEMEMEANERSRQEKEQARSQLVVADDDGENGVVGKKKNKPGFLRRRVFWVFNVKRDDVVSYWEKRDARVRWTKKQKWRRKLNSDHKMFRKEFPDIGRLQSDAVEVLDKRTGQGKRVGKYSLDVKLGRGGFGQVFGTHTSKTIAIKVQTKTQMRSKRHLDLLNTEIGILSRHGHHVNIVGFQQSINAPENIYIVMERATMSVGDLMKKTNVFCAQEDAVQQVMKGLLNGVKYLHERGVAHRDLKVDNLLVCTSALDENNRLRRGHKIDASSIRLCDFGLAKLSRNYDPSYVDVDNDGSAWEHGLPMKYKVYARGIAGTYKYMAPDVTSKKYEARRADIWSVGRILLGMAAGYDTTNLDIASKFLRQDDFAEYKQRVVIFLAGELAYVPSAAFGKRLLHDLLFRNLLVFNAKYRATAAEALDHEWLN